MKKRAKAILMFAFLGGIMVTSTVVIAIPGLAPVDRGDPFPVETMDYDYAENYPETDRERFCGSGQSAGSTDYVQEYEIPTECTNPLAITTDYVGNLWFAESNAGRVAKFDPITEVFTEYPNPNWPAGVSSMMWGMDYAPNGLLWFTDEATNSLWAFNTISEEYGRVSHSLGIPKQLPQRLLVDGSQIIVNDLYGNMLTFLNPSNPDSFVVAPSPIEGAVTAGFTPDGAGGIWYTSWVYPDGEGYLVRFDYDAYMAAALESNRMSLPPISFIELYELPSDLETPNGVTMSADGKIWLADTSSSSVYEFDPSIAVFVQYVTADPMPSAYGNKTGVIKTPISRPYWIDTDDSGRIIFNSHGSNNISVVDPLLQTIVEYNVPSGNPLWSDCTGPEDVMDDAEDSPLQGAEETDCGIAQVFDFAIHEEKIWFTEWAENKIGVVDTSISLPFGVETSSEFIMLAPGGSETVNFSITGDVDGDESLTLIAVPAKPHINAVQLPDFLFEQDANVEEGGATNVLVSASEDTPRGFYKVLLGAQTPDIAVGKYVTVMVT